MARKALAAQAAAGKDPRASSEAGQKRGDANEEHHRRNRSWNREHPEEHDEAWFKREITPKLDAFTLAQIAKASGLSLAACSRVRAGTRVPHARHGDTLRKLATSEKEREQGNGKTPLSDSTWKADPRTHRKLK